VTTVLQMEVVHYLTNQLADSEPYVDRAATLLAEYDGTGIGGRDATVLAAMERHGVERLWTHDGGLKRLDDRLDWLTVTDPVE
jgi:predicted nucleic acid-binding protein